MNYYDAEVLQGGIMSEGDFVLQYFGGAFCPGGILSGGCFVRGGFCPGGIMSWIRPA